MLGLRAIATAKARSCARAGEKGSAKPSTTLIFTKSFWLLAYLNNRFSSTLSLPVRMMRVSRRSATMRLSKLSLSMRLRIAY